MGKYWHTNTPGAPPLKTTEKVYKDIPKLEDYGGEFPDELWEKWIRHDVPVSHVSWISADKLREEAREAGYESPKLDASLNWLENGINVGCNTEEARMSTEQRNHPSCNEHGELLTDTIQGWCAMGICAGPYEREQLEDLGFKGITINPMQVRVKPNGKLRIILDQSAPHLSEREAKPGVPNSVNSGIRKRDFTCEMATTMEVNRTLHRLGYGTEFTKIDWSSAYKVCNPNTTYTLNTHNCSTWG